MKAAHNLVHQKIRSAVLYPTMKEQIRRLGAAIIERSPGPLAYYLRSTAERFAFLLGSSSAELPPIFHYWSHNYLLPKLVSVGCSSSQDLFAQKIAKRAIEKNGHVRCLSLASGRSDLEIDITKRVLATGENRFTMVCTDLNSALLRIGKRASKEAQVAEHFEFRAIDINSELRSETSFDIVIANQCLHHFIQLEDIFDTVYKLLHPEGEFLVTDVIGRNGHQLWPEALEKFEVFWHELPAKYRYDHTQRVTRNEYVNYNHANVGFEGIRAQDILKLLNERFSFSEFVPFGCITMPFVERRFGWNFDPSEGYDVDFIDRVAKKDDELIAQGILKPTQLIGVLGKGERELKSYAGLTPGSCVRDSACSRVTFPRRH